MSEIKRTFEITLPQWDWKQSLVIAGVSVFLAIGTYWWKAIRPFVRIEQAVLYTPTTNIHVQKPAIFAGCALEEGDHFQKNQLLFSLENGALFSQLKQTQEKIALLTQTLEQEKIAFEQAMQEYIRLQGELKSHEFIDQMLVEVQEAQQKVDQGEEDLILLQSELLATQKAIEEQTVSASFDGMVLRRFKQIGEAIAAGESVLLVCNPKISWVEAEIPETMLSQVQIGQPASISFPSFPSKKWAATVSWLSPMVLDGKIKVRLAAEGLPLKPGLSATASIQVR